jgi:hypothetical protein
MHDVRVRIDVLDINERMTCLFLGEEWSMIIMLPKEEEHIGNNDGV